MLIPVAVCTAVTQSPANVMKVRQQRMGMGAHDVLSPPYLFLSLPIPPYIPLAANTQPWTAETTTPCGSGGQRQALSGGTEWGH